MNKITVPQKNQELTSGITTSEIDELFRYFVAFYGRRWESGLPDSVEGLKKVKYVWYNSLKALHVKDFKLGINMIQGGRAFATFPPTPGLFYNLCTQCKKSLSGFNPVNKIEFKPDIEIAKTHRDKIWKMLGRNAPEAESDGDR